MSRIMEFLKRFGGVVLLDNLPSIRELDFRQRVSDLTRAELNARIRAVEIDVDVQARKQLSLDDDEGAH